MGQNNQYTNKYSRKQAGIDLGNKTIRQVKYLQAQNKLATPITKKSVQEYLRGDDISMTISNPRQDSKETIFKSQRITTAPQMFALLELDEKNWEVKNISSTYWGSPTNANFRVKLDLKRCQNFDKDLIESIFDNLRGPKRFPKVKYKKSPEPVMMEVNLFDLHFGKLAWAPETGEDYDSKIARKRFMGAIEKFAGLAKMHNVSEVWFPLGNDFFNSDGYDMQTTAGTQQHDDGRWQKTYFEGVQLMIDGIEYLRQHVAPVKVFNVMGNHDMQKSYYAINHIKAWYRKTSDVTVDVSPMKDVAYQFGKVGIYYTHGDKGKLREFGQDFMVKYHDIWSNTQYREVHVGHKHHEYVIEVKGAKIRILPSLSGTDAWHYTSGYVGNLQQAQMLIWSGEDGLQFHYNHTVCKPMKI
jgi:hypothetical protein